MESAKHELHLWNQSKLFLLQVVFVRYFGDNHEQLINTQLVTSPSITNLWPISVHLCFCPVITLKQIPSYVKILRKFWVTWYDCSGILDDYLYSNENHLLELLKKKKICKRRKNPKRAQEKMALTQVAKFTWWILAEGRPFLKCF